MDYLEQLKSALQAGNWSDDPDVIAPYLAEWRGAYRGDTPLLAMPASTDAVSAVLRICSEAGVGVVPQGGNTGLCGGAVPDAATPQILMSMSRMNRIRAISAADYSMVAEAGCTLQQLQEAAAELDRFFPLSLSSEGSCQIGGNLSTNAGGINVLRYGTARDLCLGLEVVLADGRVWNGLRRLRKDTAGYDLKQLFIGAEGTLGVITAASLRLFPAVRDGTTAVASIVDPEAAVSLLASCRRHADDRIQAFELIPEIALRFVLRHIPGTRFPLAGSAEWYVLIETAGRASESILTEALSEAMSDGIVRDAAIAKNRAEAADWWRTRHSISEAQRHEGTSLKHDVSVPVAEIGEFIEKAAKAVRASWPEVRIVAFGHVGDGNVHFNVSQPESSSSEAFLALREDISGTVYDAVADFHGSISAEHGIGIAKRGYLEAYKSETEITLMRALKSALDPDNILNPGKVI